MLHQHVGLDECDAGSLNQGEVFPTEESRYVSGRCLQL